MTVQQDGVRFIFSTLWSKISAANQWHTEANISDFHVIKMDGRRFSASRFNQLYADSIRFIESELNSGSSEKKVVVTHHVPTFLNYPEKYKSDDLNGAFVSELSDLMETFNPDCWIYGHHHNNIPDFEIAGTRVVTNQVGYVQYNEHQHFSVEKYIVL